ncbi:MAG: DUF262 domain-containing protein [Bacteroidales bacterium]|nr:DUF262 domain-containing protein [Bacteroidales bacterium]
MKKFQVRPFENKTLTWWFNRKDKIDMRPTYQRRGKLWSDADKAYLIDSILNGYDVPKLYIADFIWGSSQLNKKKLPYAIIDGKQRLEAIFGFFEGSVVLNDDFIYLENPKLKLGGLSYKDIKKNHKEISDEFDTYNLMAMSVIAEDEEPINELFIRLNRSKPLTGAEIRNAMKGPAPEIIRLISKHEFFVDNIKFDVKRGQDLNAAAKVLAFEYYQDFYDTKKKDLDSFVIKTSTHSKEKLELAGRHVLDNLEKMSDIFLPRDNLLRSAGLIPVYYWFVKKVNPKYYPKVRKFIVQFEEQRKLNRSLVKSDPKNKSINLVFVEYDNYNRSTNNLQSHRERCRILLQYFNDYPKAEKRIFTKKI